MDLFYGLDDPTNGVIALKHLWLVNDVKGQYHSAH